MKTKKYFVVIDGYIEAETNLAVLISHEWHPKSVFHDDESLNEGESGEFIIARWYAVQQDLDFDEQQ